MLAAIRVAQQSNIISSIWSKLKMRVELHLGVWLFLCAVALCGIAFGGIVAGQLNHSDSAVLGQSVGRLLSAIQQHQLATSSDLWWHRMVGDAQILALLWLFGVSVIGLPFVVIAIFLRGFSVGFSVGFTVVQFGWRGLLVAAIAIFLHQIVSLTSLICAGVLAIRFSAGILRQVYPIQKMTIAFVRYTGMFSVCGVGLMVGACIQAYVAPWLLHSVLAT